MRVLAAFLFAASCVTAVVAAQQVLRVPGQYATIQAAVDASFSPLDVVLVAPGRYVGEVDAKGKALTIVSVGGASVTSIVSTGRGRIPTVFLSQPTFGTAVVEGFTITGPITFDEVRVAVESDCTVRNCIVEHGNFCNISARGTAIVEANEVRFSYSELGGIFVEMGSNGTVIRGNYVHDNANADYSDRGAGITARRGTIVEDNVIMRNDSEVLGGGILAERGATIRNNVVAFNRAAFGGGIAVDWSGPGATVCEGNLLLGNTAARAGGLGVVSYPPARARIGSNVVVRNQGGGIYVEGDADVTNNTIVGNSGDGLELGFGTMRLWNTVAVGNTPADVAVEGRLDVRHCFIPGGRAAILRRGFPSNTTLTWGPGNITGGTPGFVDPTALDFRLRADAVCVDRGDSTAPFGAVDFGGDPRFVGVRPDIGADELYANVRVGPIPRTGGRLTLVGESGAPAWLGVSTALGPPRVLPGLTGRLLLDPASLTVRLPGSPRPLTVSVQALVGFVLSEPRCVDFTP